MYILAGASSRTHPQFRDNKPNIRRHHVTIASALVPALVVLMESRGHSGRRALKTIGIALLSFYMLLRRNSSPDVSISPPHPLPQKSPVNLLNNSVYTSLLLSSHPKHMGLRGEGLGFKAPLRDLS